MYLVANPTTLNVSLLMTRDGQKYAQHMPKLSVLSRGWRNTRYVVELGYELNISAAYAQLILHRTGPTGGLLDRYATACEAIVYVQHVISICSANTHSRADP